MPNQSKSLQIRSDFRDLDRMRDEVESFIGDVLSSVEKNRVLLAVDEAVSNIIEHAHGEGSTHPIDFEMTLNDDILRFVLQDRGDVFNPKTIPEVDLDSHRESGKEGGLGVYLYRKIMEVDHSPRAGGGNILSLTYKIKAV